MGLLKSIFRAIDTRRHSAEAEMNEDEFVELVAKKMLESAFDDYFNDSGKARENEQKRRDEEGRRLRKEAILAQGVEESLFTDCGAYRDALYLLEEFAPQYHLIGIDVASGRVCIDYQNLTKTRKLPKNVVIEHVDSFGRCHDDNAILHIKKLKDGSINMADIHLWHDRVRHSVFVRTRNSRHQITCIVFSDIRKNYEETLFVEEDVLRGVDPSKVLNNSILKTWRL